MRLTAAAEGHTHTHTHAEKETGPVPTDGRQKLWQKGGIRNQQGMWCDENVRAKAAGSIL